MNSEPIYNEPGYGDLSKTPEGRVRNMKMVIMKNLIHHFPKCYAYSVKMPIGELNRERALDEDTGVFFFFFSTAPLGQTAVSGNSTLHQ